MKIYWGTNSIPELAELSLSDRNKVWHSCVRKCYKHWQTWLGLVLCGSMGGVGVIVVDWLFPYNMPMLLLWSGLLIVLFVGIGGLIYGQIVIRQVRPHLRAYIESRKDGTSLSKQA